MKKILKKARLSILFTLVTVINTGCFFQDELSVFVDGNTVFISTASTVEICRIQGNDFDCAFRFGSSPTNSFGSVIGPEEFFVALFLLDPLILQLPDEIANISGSFSGGSDFGALEITTGLSTIPIDQDRSLSAEPGTQFVIIDLPKSAPRSGDFAFNIQFDTLPNTSIVPIKALFAAHIEQENGTGNFYAPLLPCETDITQIPTISLQIPPPGDVLSLASLPANVGCDGTVYRYSTAIDPGIYSDGFEDAASR